MVAIEMQVGSKQDWVIKMSKQTNNDGQPAATEERINVRLKDTMVRNDYVGIADDTVCEIVDHTEDNVTTCYSYKWNIAKSVLYYFCVLITAGFLWLITYWKPNWKLYLTHKRCALSKADQMLLIDQFGTIFVVEVLLGTYPNQHVPFREKIETQHNIKKGCQYKYFIYRRLKHYYNESSGAFVELEGADNNGTINDIYKTVSSCDTFNRQELLQWFGKNIIDIKVKSYVTLFFEESADPFYIFQALSCLLWFFDNYYYYASAIVFISLTSIILSIYQTRKHLISLHDMISKSDEVKILSSDGSEVSIHSDELVPGDILVIPKEGTMLLCDAALISGTAIVNESMLTGESVPVTKTSLNKPKSPTESDIYDSIRFKRNTLFCGTEVLQTRYFGDEKVLAVVVKTGFTTMKGGLIRSILYPKPVDFKFFSDAMKFVGVLAIFAVIGLIYTIIVFYYQGASIGLILKRSLDVFTIAVPPALPAAMSVGTVYALQRLKKDNIFCISPSRINISGHLNLFCFDKTGTLTEDGLDFCGTIPVVENEFLEFQQTVSDDAHDTFTAGMATCHSLTIIDGKITGDPLDLKMFEATGWDLEESGSEETERYGRMVPTIVRPKLTAADSVRIKFLDDKSLPLEVAILKQFTFSSELQRMSVIVRKLGAPNMEVFVKGSPEMIASLSKQESLPANFEDCLIHYTKQGYRVLAIAHKLLPKSIHWHKIQHFERSQAECELTFLGFIVMKNLLKPVTANIIKELQKANIRSVMVTGDNMLTAVSVARECHMVKPSEKIVSISIRKNNDLQYNIVGELDQMEHESNAINFKVLSSDYVMDRNFHLAVTGKVFAHIHEHHPSLFERLLTCGTIFARMLPDQKTLLVDSLQKIDYSVGMCGDGANDCGALKRANSGISLSETEASVASPFTSKTPNIGCVIDVIKEGRCALVTSFNIFKYMALYSMIQYSSVLIFYYIGSNLGDMQYLYIDLMIIMPFAITMSRTGPSGKLVSQRPLGRLVHPIVLFSIISHILIQCGFQVGMFYFVQQLPYYKPPDNFENISTDASHFSYENTVLFCFTSFQYIFMALLFSVGRPFRKPFYTNLLFLLSLIVLLAFTTVLTVKPVHDLRQLFALVEMQSSGYYHYVFFGLILCNLMLSVCIEQVLLEAECMKKLLKSLGKKEKSKYKQILNETLDDIDWQKEIGV